MKQHKIKLMKVKVIYDRYFLNLYLNFHECMLE